MRNIEEEMKMADNPLFNHFKKKFREHLTHKHEYLPEILLTEEVQRFLEWINGSGSGECILDLFAGAAVEVASKHTHRLRERGQE